MGVSGWVGGSGGEKTKNLETKINKILTSSSPLNLLFLFLNLWWELLLTQFFFLHLVMTLPLHPFIITFFTGVFLCPT